MRLVPSRQPVERSCCMSTPTLQATKTMAALNKPTSGLCRPRATRTKTVITNALDSGFQSEMPCEIPFTSMNTNERPTATARKNTGWPRTWLPTITVDAPEGRGQKKARRPHYQRRNRYPRPDYHSGADGAHRKRSCFHGGDFERRHSTRESRQHAASQFGNRAPEQFFVRQRAQDVSHRESRRIRQLHAIHQQRRVEHPHPRTEHPDRRKI